MARPSLLCVAAAVLGVGDSEVWVWGVGVGVGVRGVKKKGCMSFKWMGILL